MSIQELLKAVILNGEKLSDFELTKGDLEEIHMLMKSVHNNLEKAKSTDSSKEQAAEVGELQEVVKIDDKGQWSLEKIMGPKTSLDYKRMNQPKQQPESQAQTIDYSSGTPKVTGNQWNTKDVTPGKSPVKAETTSRAAAKERRISEGVKSGKIIDDRPPKTATPSTETAAETFARRNKEKV